MVRLYKLSLREKKSEIGIREKLKKVERNIRQKNFKRIRKFDRNWREILRENWGKSEGNEIEFWKKLQDTRKMLFSGHVIPGNIGAHRNIWQNIVTEICQKILELKEIMLKSGGNRKLLKKSLQEFEFKRNIWRRYVEIQWKVKITQISFRTLIKWKFH